MYAFLRPCDSERLKFMKYSTAEFSGNCHHIKFEKKKKKKKKKSFIDVQLPAGIF